ncbi:cytochrome c oxidase assembly protein [Pseudonocardia sp. DLS-67]
MAHASVEPATPPPSTRPAAEVAGLVGVGGLIAVLVAGGIAALSGAGPAAALGLPDPGTLTVVGLPAMRAVSEICMVLTIGAVLLATFLVAPQRSGYLDVAGYRALRAASWTAAGWTAAAVLMVPLSMADALGRPVEQLLDPATVLDLLPRLEPATTWALTALVAVVVLVGCRTVLTWGWTAILFGIALLGPLPVTFTGHSSTGGAHDLASDSLVLHVLAASLWVGGLVAVLLLAAARGPDRLEALTTAVPRYSALALVCWFVIAATGVINALVRIPLDTLVGTTYGTLVLVKAGALVALGGMGALHRRSSVAAAARGEPAALMRLGGVEVLLMLATIGIAVALGRTAPPDTGAGPPSRIEVVIGYDLSGPPTLARLALDWRFDLIFGTAALVLAGVYLLGVRRLHRRGDRWVVGRTAAWLTGCAALLVATSSGLGRYGPAMFSVHMGQHMILNMLVPILLVLGAPVTLALRALRPAGRTGQPGPREWLLAAVHSPIARLLTHPLVTLVLFVGSFYALYFSALFPAALPEHWAHKVMNLHFLLVGVLFFWPIVGIDPAPRRLPPAARMGLVFASVPFHAFFGVAVMSGNHALGGDYYRSLALPWVPDVLADQRLGGGLAWAAGEIPLLIVVISLLIQWSRQDERSARRADRHADVHGDAELDAYNAMLRRLATGRPPFVADSDENANEPAHTKETTMAGHATDQAPPEAGSESVSAGRRDADGPAEATRAPRDD